MNWALWVEGSGKGDVLEIKSHWSGEWRERFCSRVEFRKGGMGGCAESVFFLWFHVLLTETTTS